MPVFCYAFYFSNSQRVTLKEACGLQTLTGLTLYVLLMHIYLFFPHTFNVYKNKSDNTEQLAVQCFLLWTLLPFLWAPIDIRRENLEENGSKLKQLDPAHFARWELISSSLTVMDPLPVYQGPEIELIREGCWAEVRNKNCWSWQCPKQKPTRSINTRYLL